MSFLNPFFLFALITVGIPLLIYLLNVRKPKRIRFSTLAFFESLKSSSLRKIKIKRWLLLAVRTLAIAALTLALAQPFIPSGLGWMDDGEPRAVGIIIDNSPSMNRVDGNGPYFEQATELASEIIDLKQSDDRILLNVTNGESLTLPLLNKGAASREIENLESRNKGNYLAENLEKTRQQLKNAPEPNKQIYLITDGQESQLDVLNELENEEENEIQLQLIQVGEAESANVGIRDVEISSGEAGVLLRAIVQNYGTQPTGNQFINFNMGDEMIAQQAYNLEAGESRDFEFILPETEERFIQAEFLIEGDELTFDNRFYTAIQLPEERQVLVVSEEASSQGEFQSYLRPLLDAASEENDRLIIEYAVIDDLTPGQFEQTDAIVLDGVQSIPDYLSQAMIERVQNGGGLLLLPAADGNMQSYNRLLGISDAGRYSDVRGSYGSFDAFDRLASPDEGHPILESLFELSEGEEVRVNLPELFYYYQINSVDGSASSPILTSRTGNVILNETVVGNGKLIYSAIGSDPGWSNFPVKPLFAPLFYQTVDYLARGEGAVVNHHRLGEPIETQIENASGGTVELTKNDETIIPTTRQTFSGLNVTYQAAEWTPGWFSVNQQNGQKKLFSINQQAMESSLISLNTQEIESLLDVGFQNYMVRKAEGETELLVSQLETASFGQEIWHWFIIAAIFLLLLESLISRHYKAESIS